MVCKCMQQSAVECYRTEEAEDGLRLTFTLILFKLLLTFIEFLLVDM